MTEKTVGFEIRVSVGAARWGLAGLFLLTGAGELASESVTLTTYYPAPSGVYTQAITTSYSFFARDGGGVSIGTTDVPDTNAGQADGGGADKLVIMGGNVGIGTTNPQAKLHILNGNWDPANSPGDFQLGNGTYRFKIGQATGGGGVGDVRMSASGGTGRIFIGYNSGGTNYDTLKVQNNRLGIVHASAGAPLAALDVGGDGVALLRQTCTMHQYGNGVVRCGDAPAAPCAGAGGCYVTMASGLYVNRWELGAETTNTGSGGAGTMLCCNLPGGGSAF